MLFVECDFAHHYFVLLLNITHTNVCYSVTICISVPIVTLFPLFFYWKKPMLFGASREVNFSEFSNVSVFGALLWFLKFYPIALYLIKTMEWHNKKFWQISEKIHNYRCFFPKHTHQRIYILSFPKNYQKRFTDLFLNNNLKR